MPVALELRPAPSVRRAPRRRNRTGDALLCTAAAAAAFAAVLLLLGVRYEVNDDALISCIAAGAYGDDTVHLCYVNLLVGWLLKPFYTLLPGWNWYVLFSVAGLFGCAVLLCRGAVDRFGRLPGLCLWGCGMLLVGVDALHAFQYTKNAAIFAVTGWLLLASPSPRRSRVVAGCALLLAGACLRWQSFAAVTAMAAPLLVLTWYRTPAPRRSRTAWRFLLPLALCLAVWQADRWAYRLDPDWNAWQRYNTVRTEISDHRLQYLSADGAADYGLSAADYALLDSWDYGDTALYPLDELQTLAETLPHRTPLNAVRETLLALPDWLLTTLPGWAVVAALLGWLAGCRHSRAVQLAGLATLAVFAAGVYWLVLGGRTPWRTQYLMLMSCAVLLAALWNPALRPSRRLAAAALVLCATVSFGTLRQTWRSACQFRADHLPGNEKEQAIQALLDDKEHLYVVSTALEDDLAGKDVWHTRQAGAFDHLAFLGGWAAQSPLYGASLRASGLDPTAPLLDAVDNPGVYFVDFAGVQDKCDALAQRLGLTVRAEAVDGCSWWTVYRLTTDP